MERKGYVIPKGRLNALMKETQLYYPLGGEDINELVSNLGPGDRAGKRLSRKSKDAEKRYAEEVARGRRRLRLPTEGLSVDQARNLHKALLDDAFNGSRVRLRLGGKAVVPRVYWAEILQEASNLCTISGVDPRPLDDLRILFGKGGVDRMIGVRKLLDPQGVFKFGGNEIDYHPSITDQVIGNLLWGLPFTSTEATSSPSITWTWERLPDGGGRFFEETYHLDDATPREAKQLRASLRQIKKEFRRRLLTAFQLRRTWVEEWRRWNRLFPDLAFPSPGALRKAVAYQRKVCISFYRRHPVFTA